MFQIVVPGFKTRADAENWLHMKIKGMEWHRAEVQEMSEEPKQRTQTDTAQTLSDASISTHGLD
jgi:hypothetical protein